MRDLPPLPPPTDVAIPADDGVLHGVRWGGFQSGRAPLVFLHEALGSVSRWRDFPATLGAVAGRCSLAYDRRGHGLSPPLAAPRKLDYLDREAAVVLPAVLAATGVERPILYGHSDGATIALLFAAAFPDAVSGVIVEAPHVVVEPETRAGIVEARAAFARPPLFRRLARHHGDKTSALLDAWSGVWLSVDFGGWSIVDAMAGLAAPLLLIQGAGDAYGTRRQLELIADRARGPVSLAILQDCGHAPHHEARPLVLSMVRAFLSGL